MMRMWCNGQRGSRGIARLAVVVSTAGIAGFAAATDWDGNFAVDGDASGKIDDPVNWAGNTTPSALDSANFVSSGLYTVLFGVDFESTSGGVQNGSAVFDGGGSLRTYTLNDTFTIESNLLVNADVDLVWGTKNDLSLAVISDGNFEVYSFGNVAAQLTVGSTTTDGNFELNGGVLQVEDVLGFGGDAKGSILDLKNSGYLNVLDDLSLSRVDNTSAELYVQSDADAEVGGTFRLADVDSFTSSALVDVNGAGSTFTHQSGDSATIGSNGTSDATFIVNNGGTATFNSPLAVGTNGVVQNLDGKYNFNAATTIAGEFRKTGGTTNINAPLTITSAANFLHLGGALNFNADTDFLTVDELVSSDPTNQDAQWFVRNGADVALGRRLRVGSDTGEFGEIEVSGEGSLLRNTSVGGSADLVIGFEGDAELAILDGGVVDFYDDTIIGQDGSGEVTVSGVNSAGNASTLKANRNGSGSNLFVGLSGSGVLNVVDGGEVEVGNDLAIEFNSNSTPSSAMVGNVLSSQTDTPAVTVGNDLLIGPATMHTSGTTGTLTVGRLGQVSVLDTTNVRAGGGLTLNENGKLNTVNLTVANTGVLTLEGGTLTLSGGIGDLNHGTLKVGGTTPTLDIAGFRVQGGGEVSVAGAIEIAADMGTFASTVVSGEGSLLETDLGLFTDARVGEAGDGLLAATDGGKVRLGGFFRIGASNTATSGDGLVQVFGVTPGGVRSTLEAQGAFVGNRGKATLEIRHGALFFSSNTAGAVVLGDISGFSNGNANTVLVSGAEGGFDAELQARQIDINGSDSTLRVEAGGRVSVFNTAAAPLFAASIEFNGDGRVELDGGHIDAERIFLSAVSVFDWTAGDLFVDEVVGRIENTGTGTLHIGQTPGVGTLDFSGTLISDGHYTQGADASLALEIAGLSPGTQFDTLTSEIVDLASGTTLDVSFIDGFAPNLGDTFSFLTASDTLTGTFDNIQASGLDSGLGLQINAAANSLTLEVIAVAALPGDYNGDGFVSQADLDLVLLNWGDSVVPGGFDETALPGGGPFDGLVSQNELDGVLLNWGNGTPPNASAIPEPTSAGLLGMLGVAAYARSRRVA